MGSREETDHAKHSLRNRRLDRQYRPAGALLEHRDLLSEQFKEQAGRATLIEFRREPRAPYIGGRGAGNRTDRPLIRLYCRHPSIRKITRNDRPAAAVTTATTGPGALSATATSAANAPARPEVTNVMNVPLLASTFGSWFAPTRWL